MAETDRANTADQETPTSHRGIPPWVVVLAGVGRVAFVAGVLLERIAISLPAADASHLAAYVAATMLGLLVGATELVARYRDAPVFAVRSPAGIVYMATNAGVSLIIFWLLRTGQIGQNLSSALGPTLSQVLLAGIGGMALLRTSIFTLRVRDKDVAVGPAALLQVILGAADRACDRDRAGPRAVEVRKLMEGISIDRAKLALPAHCLALMQNITADEKEALDNAIKVIDSAAMSGEVKAYNLGLVLMTYVGSAVLREAIQALGPVLQGPAADDPPILAQAPTVGLGDLAPLIEICLALDPVTRNTDPQTLRKTWLSLDPSLTRSPDKVLVVLARLRRHFGPDTLAKALTYLAAGRVGVTIATGETLTADKFTA